MMKATVGTFFCMSVLMFAAACGNKPAPQPDPSASASAEAAAAKSAAAASASAKAAASASAKAAAKAEAAKEYRDVPHAEWVGVVGPKLPAGAVVAHKVFEGWPTEKALFVLTKERNQFYARVFADGRVYKAGPLANPALQATRVNAVSFFDADGDGKTDAAIIARYKEGDDHNPYNALLAWTTTSIERMTALEPKVLKQETIAEMKKILAQP